MNTILDRNRRNLVVPPSESWKPPLFRSMASGRDEALAKVRRIFDLPAGSIWRDLSDILPTCFGTILDVGCGAQPYRSLFPASAEYRAIDVERAGGDFGYFAPDTTYFEGTRWPIADASVDVALATETLEHVEDVSGFLGEAARCLRPGGRLILTVPFAARWHFIPHDYWRFTPSGIKLVLAPHGLNATIIWARGNALSVACYKNMALILPLYFPTTGNLFISLFSRAVGLVFLPLLVALALVGTASLRAQGGDDCLGYTVIATLGQRTSVPEP